MTVSGVMCVTMETVERFCWQQYHTIDLVIISTVVVMATLSLKLQRRAGLTWLLFRDRDRHIVQTTLVDCRSYSTVYVATSVAGNSWGGRGAGQNGR